MYTFLGVQRFLLSLPSVALVVEDLDLPLQYSSTFSDIRSTVRLPSSLDGCPVLPQQPGRPTTGTGSLPATRTGSLPATRTDSLPATRAGSLPAASPLRLPSASGRRPNAVPGCDAAKRPTAFLRLQAAAHHLHHRYRRGGDSANSRDHHVCVSSSATAERFGDMRSRVLHPHSDLLWHIPLLPHVHHPRFNPGNQGHGVHRIRAEDERHRQHRAQCGGCCQFCAVPRYLNSYRDLNYYYTL